MVFRVPWVSVLLIFWNYKNYTCLCAQNEPRPVIRVTTILCPPYLTLKESANAFQGNEVFEGYCKDLADLLSEKLGWRYKLQLVKDSSYGTPAENGSWTGMVGEILNNETDVAISAMTITAARSKALDFTFPFIQLRLGVLTKSSGLFGLTPSTRTSYLFLKPFTPGLWSTFIFGLLVLFGILYGVESLASHYENSRPAEGEPEGADVLKERQKIRIGSPRSLGGKVLLGNMLVYVFVFLAAYVGNFSSLQMQGTPGTRLVRRLQDFGALSNVQYGAVQGGSTVGFLRDSSDPTHRRIYRKMRDEGTFTASSREGIRRVLESDGSYVLIMEELSARYAAIQNCELRMVPEIFGPLKGFGIALRPGSPLLKRVNIALSELSEAGDLEALERKWWGTGCSGNKSEEKYDSVGPNPELSLGNMTGLFYLLLACLLIVMTIAFTEAHFVDKGGQAPVSAEEAQGPEEAEARALEEVTL